MNYYEQFYDDLEFADPEDDPYYRDYPPRDYHHGNQAPGWGHHDEYTYQHQQRSPRGRGHDYRDREFVNEREQHEYTFERGRGRDSEPDWRGRGQRGRGQWGRVRGNVSHGRGRGGRDQRGRGPSIGFVNFVKATVTSNEQSEPNKTGSQTTCSSNVAVDFITTQSHSTAAGQMAARQTFVAPVLSSYGYGEGSGFENFGATPFQAMSVDTPRDDGSTTPVAIATQPVLTTAAPQQPAPTVKRAVVSPMVNFVKAQNEFKSTDVAFHEAGSSGALLEARDGHTPGIGKRAGLGTSAAASSHEAVHDSFSFQIGRQGDSNPKFDRMFQTLKNAVKEKNLPSKNGIEILHMAVDKIKMRICDEIKCSGRSPFGQPMFECRLEINGVSISEASNTAKKRAKHEAYQKAVEMFLTSQELTVVERATGGLVLVPKAVNVPATTTAPSMAPIPRASTQGPVGIVSPTSKTSSALSDSKSQCTDTVETVSPKPKIVFHQSAQQLTTKSHEFKFPQPPPPANPQAMAMKLLNSVKETVAESGNSHGLKPDHTFRFAAQAGNSTAPHTFPYPPRRPTTNIFRNTSDPDPDRGRYRGFKRGPPGYGEGKLAVQCKKVKNQWQDLDDLSQFILVDDTLMKPGSTNSNMGLLHMSANWNRVVLKIEYDCDVCRLCLADHVVAQVPFSNKEQGRLDVSEKAMEYLKKVCYTIVIKQQVDTDSDAVSRDELIGDDQTGTSDRAISDDNVGNRLLRKMGWVGGGCGKDGTGIAEPVKASVVIGREGLGLNAEKGVGGDFHKKVKDMLQDYIQSEAQHDLHFSAELSKEQRAAIHKTGQSLGLKTQSKGKNENRFLIVSRKRSVSELFQHIIQNGGETNKYLLIAPGNPELASYNHLRPENLYHGNQ